MRHDQIPDDLKPLAFEFFYWFSRFEFALKANWYLKSEQEGARAEPGWTRFVRKFESGYALSTAAQKLIEANPRRQLVGKHELEFADLMFGPKRPISSASSGSPGRSATICFTAASQAMTAGTTRSACASCSN